ncbi:MAG: LysE family transporter [Bacteroidota bacterium]
MIIKAIITGLILSIMVGPTFFLLLETSIKRGVRAALYFDLGVLIADILYIAIAYVFFAEVATLTKSGNNSVLKIVGGIIFVSYGALSWFKKPKTIKVNELGIATNSANDYFILCLKGFLLNMANPLIIFYWFTVMTTVGNRQTADGHIMHSSLILFVTIILVTFFAIDILKILGAKKLRPLINDQLLFGLNRVICLIFFVFGIILVLQGILPL